MSSDMIIRLLTGDMTDSEKNSIVRFFWRSLLMFHILWACGWLSAIGLPGFVQANELKNLEQSVAKVTEAVRINKLEQQLQALEAERRRLDQEIFNIEARIAEMTRAGAVADRIYSERLSQLRGDLKRVELRLAAFLRANNDLNLEPR